MFDHYAVHFFLTYPKAEPKKQSFQDSAIIS